MYSNLVVEIFLQAFCFATLFPYISIYERLGLNSYYIYIRVLPTPPVVGASEGKGVSEIGFLKGRVNRLRVLYPFNGRASCDVVCHGEVLFFQVDALFVLT